MSERDIALRVTDLRVSYGSFVAVDSASFEVPAGRVVGFVGPNGAGKSSTMRAIAGLIEAESGVIEMGGRDLGGDPAERRRYCSLTPQDVGLFPWLTAEETLRFVTRLRNVEDAEAEMDRWLALTGLEKARRRPVREYSGGMRRKLAIASTLIGNPPVALLDESFAGLDPESTWAVRQEIRRYVDAGGAILLSTHILDMLERIADEIVVISGGRVVRTLDAAALAAEIPDRFSTLTELYLAETGADTATERRTAGDGAADT